MIRLMATLATPLLTIFVLSHFFSVKPDPEVISAAMLGGVTPIAQKDADKKFAYRGEIIEGKAGRHPDSSPPAAVVARIGNPSLSPDSTDLLWVTSHLGKPDRDPDADKDSFPKAHLGDPLLSPDSLSASLDRIHIGDPFSPIE